MESKEKTVVFIPVRGGSKSIPLKNIKPIYGRPLLYWTLDAAVSAEHTDAVYVCTDSEAIRSAVGNYIRENKSNPNIEKVVCIGRSAESAADTATTESAMLEFAAQFEFSHIVLVQATSPLLSAEDLNRGLGTYFSGGYDSVLSVVRQKRFVWREENGETVPVNYDPLARPRRQEFDGYLVENGAFYITSRARLLQTKCRISGRIGYTEMPEETYTEIDEPSDWIIVEHLLKRRCRSLPDERKKAGIKLFATDCDGVLTDCGMFYSPEGDLLKKFSAKDGMGISFLRERGIRTAIITGEDTPIVSRRAEKLHIDDVFLGVRDKLTVLRNLAEKYGILPNQIAYIGDDVNDIPPMRYAGIAISVADAMEAAKNEADYITARRGGEGAVREAIDWLLEDAGK